MSRTRKAILGSAFMYAQFGLGIVSGFILFPLTIRYLGANDTGLWLITGELAGYLLIGDLGVFGVLPWMVAAKDGAGDRLGIARHLADALSVGLIVGLGFIAVGVGVLWADPTQLGVKPVDWEKVRGPLSLMLILVGMGFPLRAFTALLGGLQDVTFIGLVGIGQTSLTVALTATLITSGYGLPGLAIAAGVPPLIAGLVNLARVFAFHRDTTAGWYHPRWAGCRFLVREGFGGWIAGFGVKLLTASNGMVLAMIGRPDWVTVYVATAKVAHVAQPMCWIIPDSGLVGLSQLHGKGDPARTRGIVSCLLLLYLLIPGVVTLGLLIANAWFVRVWLGPSFFVGDYVSQLIAVNLLVASAASGLFKVVAVVGYRIRIGMATLAYGILVAGLGFLLGRERGMPGLVEGALIAGLGFAIPFGLYALRAVYGISIRELLGGGTGRWLLLSVPLMGAAAWIGPRLISASMFLVSFTFLVFAIAYAILLRPVLDRAPWPSRVRKWLARLRLIPSLPSRETFA